MWRSASVSQPEPTTKTSSGRPWPEKALPPPLRNVSSSAAATSRSSPQLPKVADDGGIPSQGPRGVQGWPSFEPQEKDELDRRGQVVPAAGRLRALPSDAESFGESPGRSPFQTSFAQNEDLPPITHCLMALFLLGVISVIFYVAAWPRQDFTVESEQPDI